MPNPAESLEGKVLDGSWIVGPLIPKTGKDTGGNFSQSYVASALDGRKAFVKALDFTRAFNAGADLTQVLQHVTQSFNYEVDMLNFCGTKGMDRVVRAISSGMIIIDSTPMGQVPYLVFEAAERDVRKHLDIGVNDTEMAWKLRVLHHITTGLRQLHGADVVHQDLKPSNVLIFEGSSTERVSKLADLGRALRSGVYAPHDAYDWAGDPAYQSPESLYGFIDPNWHTRRIGYDLYLLGSLCSFLFQRTTANAALMSFLPLQFHPGNWNGDFTTVLPYLQNAFSQAMCVFTNGLHPKLAADLVPVYRMLCEPDPKRRGSPEQKINKVALDRFVTRFDLMASRASVGRYR